jgi:hypothetical protein
LAVGNPILLFLVLVLGATVGLAVEYSYASNEQDNNPEGENSQETEDSEKSGENDSEDSEESGDDSETESRDVTPMTEETTNDTIADDDSPPKSETMKPSDIFPINQTSNQTNQTSLSPKVLPPVSPNVLSEAELGPPAYRVKTTFYWIQVHNDHDGLARGDGEWDMAAFVQGIKVPLTEKSCRGNYIVSAGSVPPCGLGSIEGGKDAVFSDEGKPLDAGTSVTVDLPRTVPLSIFTAGIEEDDCGRAVLPDEKHQQELMLLMRDERLNWIEPIRQFISDVRATDSVYTVSPTTDPICGYSDLLAGSDKLGNLIRFYEPIDYGASDR